MDTRLLVMPKGNLRKVPFAALPILGTPIVESFVPTIVPSLERLGPPIARQEQAPSLVVGNPDLSGDESWCWTDLPAAAIEANYAASRLTGSTLLTGEQASHDAVLAMLTSETPMAVVYLATHGISDPVNPADGSFLALAGDHLVGAELRNIELNGNPLVVLSACQTGLGKDFDQGTFGLPEAWHFAGSDRIVMSLWNVDDAGTQRLMKQFIDYYDEQELANADLALARAARDMRRENPDPMIWAAFSYFGSP